MDVARAEHVSLQSKALEETTVLLTCFQDQTERERQRASERESERERERERKLKSILRKYGDSKQ